MPSTSSPREAWKRRTAARVIGPYSPSAATPSARCSAAVVEPPAPAPAPPPEGGVDRPDHAVDGEPARGLERVHGLTGLRAEDAVGGDPSAAWAAATAGPRLP